MTAYCLRDFHDHIRGVLLATLYARAHRERVLTREDVFKLAFERYGRRSMLALTVDEYNDLYSYMLTRPVDHSHSQTTEAQCESGGSDRLA